MATIYEIESGFESLDAMYAQFKAYVRGAVGQEAIHEVEKHLFRRLQQLGRGFLEVFVAQSGTGYEAGNPPVSEAGVAMEYKETASSPYVSIFGEITIARASYAHPEGGRVYPIDAQLNLPEHKYSYLLLKWLQSASADQDYRGAVDHFNEIFDFSFFPQLPQRQGKPVAAYVESFYEQIAPPAADTEGSHIAVSADCKGVRILRSEREGAEEASPPKARRGKGEKPGIKKDAVVVTDFSFDPCARKAEEIVKGLLNQFTQQEKENAQEERQRRREAELPEPRQPLNKHVFATMEGKQAAFAHLLDHVEKRDPDGHKPLIALLDGDPYLEDRLLQELTRRGMTDRLEVCILDIIHASEYLWEVATALYGEKGKKRIPWVEAKLYALLDSKVGYILGSLKQIGTKNQLQPHQQNVLEKTITYFENHRPMMDYATYLEKGYPIATGVIEGTCGSLVKDRMEDSGMRWSIAGAQVILLQRAVVQNGDWDDFWNAFIDAERERRYATVYDRATQSTQRKSRYEKAA